MTNICTLHCTLHVLFYFIFVRSCVSASQINILYPDPTIIDLCELNLHFKNDNQSRKYIL